MEFRNQARANGHNQLYGYGRVNARKAVELAAPAQPNLIAIRTATQDVPIKDLGTAKLTLPVADTAAVKAIKVTVDLEHTSIGDLIVTLQPPAATGVAALALHNREGRGADNIKKTSDTANPPTLAALHGKSPQGTWTLVVQDKERADTGKIRGFTLEMTLEPRPSRQSEGSAHWRLEQKQNPNHPSPACLSSFRRIRTTPWTC